MSVLILSMSTVHQEFLLIKDFIKIIGTVEDLAYERAKNLDY